MSLVAPRLTDDSLSLALNQAHTPALIVFEDIDALFDGHREKTEQFTVTFSGLLNAIDGVGDSNIGTLIVFTSNHPERLDPALCRKGRIDRRFHFGRCSTEVARLMFLRFYPNEDGFAVKFAAKVGRQQPLPTPVDLQHHFITHRKSTAEEAIEYIVDDTHGNDAHCMWS